MFKNLGIKTKMVLTIGTSAIVTGFSILIILYLEGRESAISNHFTRVEIVNEQKKKNIEDYFLLVQNQISTLSQSKMVVDAMKELKTGFGQVKINTKERNFRTIQQSLQDYYQTTIIPRYTDSLKFSEKLVNLFPGDPLTIAFQHQYISSNKFPIEEKEGLIRSEDSILYNDFHEKYHQKIKNYMERFGYHDVYLVDDSSGYIVYSVEKRIDFAQNLVNGSYRISSIAKAFQRAKTSDKAGLTFIEDFELYTPSFQAPTSFIAAPIFDGKKRIGVLVFQVPARGINSIVTGDQTWGNEGLQKSGETYIVGKDFKRKSTSRLLLEDPEAYYALMTEMGVEQTILDKIRSTGSPIHLQEVKTEIVGEALEGKSGQKLTKDSHGKPFLSSYAPLSISGLTWVVVSEFSVQEALNNVNNIMVWATLGVLLIVFLAFLVAMPLGTSLAKPIIQLANDIKDISKGNLTVDVTVNSKDEVGLTALSLKKMMEKLKEVISDIIVSAESISLASKEMNSSSQQMSEGATEQASSAEEISASMEEMAANIQQNAENANETEKIAEKSSAEIINGSESATNTAESMKTIAEKISIIGEMSRLTSLLAVNAAVESIKKGVYGRGFSVVAAEIRRLSEGSRSAAIEIDEITIECVEMAQNSGDFLKEIVPKVQKTAELVREISLGSQEQNSGANQINNAIQHLNAVVQQNAATAEELAASSTELHSQADSLRDLVTFFNIGDFVGKEKEAEVVDLDMDASTEQEASLDNISPKIDDNLSDGDEEFERF